MIIGINTDLIEKRPFGGPNRNIEEMAKLCADAGFKSLDYTPSFLREDWESAAAHDLEVLSKYGITVNQTHLPFNRYGKYDAYDFTELTMRCVRASKLVDAKFVVTHADEYRTVDHYDPKEIEDFEYERLVPVAEACEKMGMRLAIENVFEDSPRTCKVIDGKCRFCSRIEELIGLVKRFNSENVGICWDFGHAHVAFGENMTAALEKAAKYLTVTHVHDNYYERDLHLAPLTGKVDWQAQMRVLKESGYKGTFSLETVYGALPDEIMPEYLVFLRHCAETVIAL